jgi:hypothetical protein
VTTARAGAAPLAARYLPHALAGYVLETQLTGQTDGTAAATISSPWDLWWACFRTAIPSGQAGVTARLPAGSCPACTSLALELAAADPPRHPGLTTRMACGCLLGWAVAIRTPAAPVTWPATSLTLALIKPGASERAVRDRLERTHDILHARHQTLTTADTRRLYPEAYGAEFVAAADAYLTSAPVHTLVLRQRDRLAGAPGEFKRRLRRELGAADVLRNHLHMADNPAEALADIGHLAGPDVLASLYERHERDRAADRLAFYRAALGIGHPGPDGHEPGRQRQQTRASILQPARAPEARGPWPADRLGAVWHARLLRHLDG